DGSAHQRPPGVVPRVLRGGGCRLRVPRPLRGAGLADHGGRRAERRPALPFASSRGRRGTVGPIAAALPQKARSPLLRNDSSAYCVLTATLVAPRVTPPASLKRTKTRLLVGSKGTVPAPVTKMPKLGVAS